MRPALILLVVSGLAASVAGQHLAPQLSSADKRALNKYLKDVREFSEDHAKHGRTETGLIVHDDGGLDVTVAQVCRADGETAAAHVPPKHSLLLWLIVTEQPGTPRISLSVPHYVEWRRTRPMHGLHGFVLAPTAAIALATDRAIGAASEKRVQRR